MRKLLSRVAFGCCVVGSLTACRQSEAASLCSSDDVVATVKKLVWDPESRSNPAAMIYGRIMNMTVSLDAVRTVSSSGNATFCEARLTMKAQQLSAAEYDARVHPGGSPTAAMIRRTLGENGQLAGDIDGDDGDRLRPGNRRPPPERPAIAPERAAAPPEPSNPNIEAHENSDEGLSSAEDKQKAQQLKDAFENTRNTKTLEVAYKVEKADDGQNYVTMIPADADVERDDR